MVCLSKRAFVGCHGLGVVRGIGVYVPATEHCCDIRLSAPLDEDERQTSNAAELTAAIAGLRLFCAGIFSGGGRFTQDFTLLFHCLPHILAGFWCEFRREQPPCTEKK